MTISMYAASAPVFVQGLKGLSIVLDKAEAYAKARKIDESVLLQARIFPDMFAFVRQCQVVTDNAKGAMARLAGQTPPSYEDTETSFEALKARVAKTIAFLQSVTAAQVDGTEDKEIVIKRGDKETHYKGMQFLLGHAVPNFYFHVTTTYVMLRHNGVEIGKRDFLGNP